MRNKVIEFIPKLHDGGAETLVKDYALLINKEKFDVIILVMQNVPNTANTQILYRNNFKIVPIFNKPIVTTRIINRISRGKYIYYRLKRIVKKYNPTIIHVHMNLLRFMKPLSKELLGIRLLYTCHSLPKLYFTGINAGEYDAAKYLIKNNSLRLIALHQEMKEELDSLFNVKNTVIIRNAINFKRFINLDEDRKEIRESLDIPRDAFVIGHIGKFSAPKNHELLIRIFRILKERRSDAFLLLVGSGALKNEIINRIASFDLMRNTLILSNRSDVPRLLKAMDVFVFPSLYEGLGIVAIEAQVVGLRCVISSTIPKDVFISEKAIPVELNEDPERWVDIILNDKLKSKPYGDIIEWDMNNEIKRIEQLYTNENYC